MRIERMLLAISLSTILAPLAGAGVLSPVLDLGACCYADGACCLTSEAACGRVGDVNGDGVIDFGDINAFVDALSGSPEYNRCAADCNRDGVIDFVDINPFVEIIGGGDSISGVFQGPGSSCAACGCLVPCPPGATPENEPCGSDTNGGCGSQPPVYGHIACGETICGTSFWDGNNRDTDWFRIEGLTGPTVFRATAEADFYFEIVLLRDSGADCYDFEILNYAVAPACYLTQYTSDCLSYETYYAWIGPNFGAEFDCDPTAPQYWMTLECNPCGVAGACCVQGSCYPGMSEWDCRALGGAWIPGEDCEPNPCPFPPAGDTCTDPIVIPEVPYSAIGSTCAYTDTYDEVCPYEDSVAPDVVYQYTPTFDMAVLVSLCFEETNYDTKLYVYEGDCPGTVVACNDDHCATASYPNPYVSELEPVLLVAGHTYFFVIDGYGEECGTFHLEMMWL